jgi:hypothetical protein
MSRTDVIINRLPHFYRSGEDYNNLYRLVSVFATLVDEAEEDLLNVMRSHWVNKANNEGSKGLDTLTKGDLDKIFSLYLENLGGTSLLRQTARPPGNGEDARLADKVYRDRMKGLIQVILGGPSTKTGLIEIVSANLGIVGDDEAAKLAKKQVIISEFLPETISSHHSNVQFLQQITAFNPNPDTISPEIIIKIPQIDFPMIRPRVVHAGTGAYWQYEGLVSSMEELIFFRDGTGLHKGRSFQATAFGGGLKFQPGENKFHLDASIGLTKGIFDNTLFDFSLFDSEGAVQEFGKWDQSGFDQVVFGLTDAVADVTVKIDHLHPASFSVSVPWDSPGFTVKFLLKPSLFSRLEAQGFIPESVLNELKKLEGQVQSDMKAVLKALGGLDPPGIAGALQLINEESEAIADLFADMAVNPRSQIRYIVNKVKAAGVFSVISYHKRFNENHDISDSLILSGQMKAVIEDQDSEEFDFAIASVQQPYPNGLSHELSDSIMLSGVFDFTGFDSLNAFA